MDAIQWDWHDTWRLLILFMSSLCFSLLLYRWWTRRQSWDKQERADFRVFITWCWASIGLAAEGIIRNSTFGFRLLFVTVAILVTFLAIRRRNVLGIRSDD